VLFRSTCCVIELPLGLQVGGAVADDTLAWIAEGERLVLRLGVWLPSSLLVGHVFLGSLVLVGFDGVGLGLPVRSWSRSHLVRVVKSAWG